MNIGVVEYAAFHVLVELPFEKPNTYFEVQQYEYVHVPRVRTHTSHVYVRTGNVSVINITGVRSNQDLIWCVKIGVYMGFNVYGGS